MCFPPSLPVKNEKAGSLSGACATAVASLTQTGHCAHEGVSAAASQGFWIIWRSPRVAGSSRRKREPAEARVRAFLQALSWSGCASERKRAG